MRTGFLSKIYQELQRCIFSFNYFMPRVPTGRWKLGGHPGNSTFRPGEKIFAGFTKLPVTSLQINVITTFIYFAAQSMTGFIGTNRNTT